ncbi:aldose 1-epimerase, partial [Candidatus Poribacteria bacterium]|nr:aldose 1-epimerase [Candidatus Poribacteria bacterium]
MPLSYTVQESEQEGVAVVELCDVVREQRARIAPGLGATCFEYRVNHEGTPRHVLEPPPDLASFAARLTGYGTPILFPFPNRIRDGKWTHRGRTHQFAHSGPGRNHIHGLVYNRPWQIEALAATADAAVCAMTFDSLDHDEIGAQYPFPFQLVAEYTLQDSSLSLRFSATNVGEEVMPMGVGFHPYFSAPIASNTEPADCLITVPADAYWELDTFLPTGDIRDVAGDYDLREGRAFDGMRFDDVFTRVILDDDRLSRCIVDDRGIGLRTVVESDAVFREFVVYTPPGRRSIC